MDNQLIKAALNSVIEKPSTSTATYSTEEIKAVQYFFAQLKLVYPRDYGFDIEATPERAKLIKNENAPYLVGYNKDQIDAGIRFVKQQKQKGEGKYLKLDVDLCIGAIREANRSRALHQDYKRLDKPRISIEEKRRLMQSVKDEVG